MLEHVRHGGRRPEHASGVQSISRSLGGDVSLGAPILLVEAGRVNDFGVALVEVLRAVVKTIEAIGIGAFLDVLE
jgi:hypothetical protein